MRTINAEELKKVLELHEIWMHSGGLKGERADLSSTDLSGKYLENVDLTDAIMRHSNLRSANMKNSDLTGADLRYANMRGANLSGANMTNSYLTGAILAGASLTNADLRNADMRFTDLRGSILKGADLTHADIKGADTKSANLAGAHIESGAIPMACPSDGAFIGWKKARHCGEAVLVKLLIPEDAKRSSATGRKCRCDKAKVIEILTMKGNIEVEFAVSEYNSSFVYKKGEVVCEPNFCEDRFTECAKGIHFFIDRKEAENYLP